MDIKQHRENNTVRLVLIGKLWLPDDISTLRTTIMQASESGIDCIIIDLSRLSFMCSLGLGMLVRMFSALKEKSIEMIFSGPKMGIRDMMEISGLANIIRIVPAPAELDSRADAP